MISILDDIRYPDIGQYAMILDLTNPERKKITTMKDWNDADAAMQSILRYFKEYDEDGNPTPFRRIKTIKIMEVTGEKAYNIYIAMTEKFKKNSDKYYEKKRLEADRARYEKMKEKMDEYEMLKQKFEGGTEDDKKIE